MIYDALELGQPGNPAIPDNYTEDSTRVVQRCTRLLLQVSTQAVFVQLGIMPQGLGAGVGSVQWQAEEPYLPMIAALARNFDAIRVRNYSKGFAGQILVTFT
jgi:hypothetical protein